MHLGRCCHCSSVRAVTIKGINTTTGVTTWEYGPGAFWRDKYGGTTITGIEHNAAATLDRYVVISPGFYGLTQTMLNRNSVTLTANCMEPLTFTVLSETDGSVASSAVTIEGLFCSSVTAVGFQTFLAASGYGNPVKECVSLSGGDFVMLCDQYPPQLELVDYASNTAAKEYVFHAHGLKAGNVTLKTLTSDETITLAYNITAASMKTALEATADITAATCTGGPWPLAKISADITWSVAGGDFKSITHDQEYDTGGGEMRRTDASATVWDPTTGLLTSTAGYVFGRGTGKTEARLIPITGLLPSPVAIATLAAGNYAASGDSNTIITATNTAAGGKTIECHTVGSTWTSNWLKVNNTSYTVFVSGPTQTWGRSEGNTVTNGFGRASFTNPTRTRSGFTIAVNTGTITEHDFPDTVGTSTTNGDNFVSVISHVGTGSTLTARYYKNTSNHASYPNLKFQFHVAGGELECDGDKFHIGSPIIYGVDADQIYGEHRTANPVFNYYPPGPTPGTIGGSVAVSYFWTFYTQLAQHFDTGTEFRFRFGTATPLYSDWMDWMATDSQIETAILNGIGENTEGVISSAVAYPFGLPAYTIVNDTGYLERGLQIRFAGSNSGAATAFAFRTGSTYFAAGKVSIETRTVTHTTTAGITAWDRITGDPVWSRYFGTTLATSANANANYAWVKTGMLFAVGGPVENELP